MLTKYTLICAAIGAIIFASATLLSYAVFNDSNAADSASSNPTAAETAPANTQTESTASSAAPPAEPIKPPAIDANTIQGIWMKDDGSTLTITAKDFGKASYTVNEVFRNETQTIIKISINGGKSISTLNFNNDDPNHMILRNMQTGYSVPYKR